MDCSQKFSVVEEDVDCSQYFSVEEDEEEEEVSSQKFSVEDVVVGEGLEVVVS